jgi:hypothetical protein
VGEAVPPPEQTWSDEACQAWIVDFEEMFHSCMADGMSRTEFTQRYGGSSNMPESVKAYVDRQMYERLGRRPGYQTEAPSSQRAASMILGLAANGEPS